MVIQEVRTSAHSTLNVASCPALVRWDSASGVSVEDLSWLIGPEEATYRVPFVLVEEKYSASGFLSNAYSHWGPPIHTFHLYESSRSSPRLVMLFSADEGVSVSRRKYDRWGLDYLLSEEQRLVAKFKTRRGKLSIQKDLAKTITNLERMDPLDPWESHGMSESNILIPESERRRKVRLPSTLVMPEGEARADLRALQRVARPEGLSADSEASVLPLRFLEYVVSQLVPTKGTVLDLGGSGDISQTVMKLNAHGANHSCFTWSGNDGLAQDRLESLSLGSWKDWTFHDPMVPGFSIVADPDERFGDDRFENEEGFEDGSF